jgi:hypothetical protein
VAAAKISQQHPLQAAEGLAIISPLQRKRCLIDERSEGKKGVDEIVVKLHNLSSLLLTNTTIRNDAARQYRILIFKN